MYHDIKINISLEQRRRDYLITGDQRQTLYFLCVSQIQNTSTICLPYILKVSSSPPPHFKHFSQDLLWNLRGTSHDIQTTQKASLVTLWDYKTRVKEVPSIDL